MKKLVGYALTSFFIAFSLTGVVKIGVWLIQRDSWGLAVWFWLFVILFSKEIHDES